MPTWPEVLGALVARTDLTSAQTAWAMGEILRRGDAGPDRRASPSRCAPRARPSRRSAAWSTRCAEHATPISVEGRLLDVVGTGATGRCRSTSRRWPRSSPPARAPGSSSTATGRRPRSPGRPTSSRRSACAWTCRPTGWRPWPPRPASRSVRGGVPPRDASRRGASARAGHRDDVQLPRPAGQPGPAAGQRDRLRRPADGAGDGRRVRPARRRRVGVPRRRRAGRAHHDDDLLGVGGQATAR